MSSTEGRTAAASVQAGQQLLGHDGTQVEGEIEQELAVFLLRDQVQDAVQRLVGIVGVQGGEAEVAGLGKLQGKPMVSWLRISPIRITSGAWRSELFSATSNDAVSMPTSRWVIRAAAVLMHEPTGSSTVRMWPSTCWLR